MARSRARRRSAALRRRGAAPGPARCGRAFPARRRALPQRRSGRRRSASEAGDPGERRGGGLPQHLGQRLPGPRRAARRGLGLSPRHSAQAGLRGGVQRPGHRAFRARRGRARGGAREEDANTPPLRAAPAAAWREAGSPEEAIACARRAVGLRPADARSREQLGSLLLDTGSAQAALPQLEEWARLQPRSPRALLALAEAHMALGNGGEASAPAQRASAPRPRGATLWLRLGALASKQRLAAQAQLAFRQAIELDRSSPGAWIRLGNLLRLGGRLDEAKACTEQAVALDDQSAAAVFALARGPRGEGGTSAP